MNIFKTLALMLTIFIFADNFLSLQLQSNPAVLDAIAKPCLSDSPNLALNIIKTGFLKRSFLNHLKEVFKANVFVETGTFLGETTKEASFVFDEVYSVELSSSLYERCATSLKNEKNIYLYQGDSALFLQNLLPSLKDRGTIIFWLDAHYSSGITVRGKKDTPVVEELKAIKESCIHDGIVLIDDMRHFYTTDCDYPSFTRTCELLLDINPQYKLALLGDVLIAFPPSHTVTISPVMWACTLSRLYDEDNHLDININAVDRQIAQAKDDEFMALKWLHDNLSWEEYMGLCHGSYNWWYGLSLLYQGHYDKASGPMKVALHSDSKKERLILLATDCLQLSSTHPCSSQTIKPMKFTSKLEL